MIVVCDTNVIIDFSKLGRLSLLKDIFKEITISIEVKDELIAGEESGSGYSDIRNVIDEWINVKAVTDYLAIESLETQMDKGEAVSIALYKEINADIFAVNDLKAREVALSMGFKVIGTLGILKIARERGLVSQIKPLLDELRMMGAYKQ